MLDLFNCSKAFIKNKGLRLNCLFHGYVVEKTVVTDVVLVSYCIRVILMN